MLDWLKKIHIDFSDMARDSAADMDCLHAALLAEGYDVTLSYNQLMYWYELVREANYDLTATVLRDAGGWRLAALEAGKSAVPLYALAVDLGSTTVSMRLLNVESGDILA